MQNRQEHTNQEQEQGEARQQDEMIDEDLKSLEEKIKGKLNQLKPTTNESIESRDRLIKIKGKIKKEDIQKANTIIAKYLDKVDDINRITDAVYAMGRTMEEWQEER